LGGLCLSDGIALLLDLSMLGCLCLSDGIFLLLGLEYVGWSLFVRQGNSTPGT
jgi:hypothetical protein